MIRHGAQLAFAYARATVPRICIILRKSYGGAYIVMDSKKMGNDLCLAWPTAEIAVMGAKGAVEILHRRATPEERAPLEADYEERLLNPYVAAERGYVDAVIEPDGHACGDRTRARDARHQAGVARGPQARQLAALGTLTPTTIKGATRVADTITIIDNRTGKEITVDITNGVFPSSKLRELDPDLRFYDPAFISTAACASAITYLDGDAGILRYRGYPIEQLAEKSTYLEVAYLLLHGELPTAEQFELWTARRHAPHVHPREHAQAVHGRASTTTPTRWGCSSRPSPRCRPSTPTRRTSSTPRPATSRSSASSRRCPRSRPCCHRFSVGHAVRLPRQHAELPGQLPLHDVEGSASTTPIRCSRRPSTCCSSSTPTTSRTAARPRCASSARPTPIRTPRAQRQPRRCTARSTAAPTRPWSACSPRSARSTTCPRSSRR